MATSTCTLCLNSLTSKCYVQCSGLDVDPSQTAGCPQVENAPCGHSFHEHCHGSLWLDSGKDEKKCPNCDESWNPSTIKVGDRVLTPQGAGVLMEVRTDNMCKVLLDWTLAYDNRVYSHIERSLLKRGPAPVLTVGERYITPQGPGELIEIRSTDDMCILRLDWTLAYDCNVFSTLTKEALTASNMNVKGSYNVGVGSRVTTPQGPGTVIEYRVSDNMYAVQLDWTLAYDNRVVSYMQRDVLAPARSWLA